MSSLLWNKIKECPHSSGPRLWNALPLVDQDYAYNPSVSGSDEDNAGDDCLPMMEMMLVMMMILGLAERTGLIFLAQKYSESLFSLTSLKRHKS